MKKKDRIILAIIAFVFSAIIFKVVFLPYGTELNDWTVTCIDENSKEEMQTWDLEVPKGVSIETPGTYELKTTFDKGDELYEYLSITRMNGYGFVAMLNGVEIERIGNAVGPSANMWNYSFLIHIPKELIKDTNELSIKVFGLHDIGFTITPTLVDEEKHEWIIMSRNFLTSNLSLITMGATYVLGLLMIFIGKMKNQKEKFYVYLGVAAICYSLSNFESIFYLFSMEPLVFLWVRKLFLGCAYASVIFLYIGMHYYHYDEKISRKIVMVILFMLGIFIAVPSNIGFLYMSKIYNIILLFVLFIMSVSIIKNKKVEIMFSLTYFLLSSIYTLIKYTLNLHIVSFLNIAIFAFLMGLLLTIVNQFIELNKKATTDKLTGAYNREYFDYVKLKENDSLGFIDVDCFKKYNDTYGHKQGDEFLIDLVRYFSTVIGEKSDVIRYGGDEFVIYFENHSEKEAIERIEEVEKYIKSQYNLVGISYGVSEVNVDIENTLRIVDDMMYEMKGDRKKG